MPALRHVQLQVRIHIAFKYHPCYTRRTFFTPNGWNGRQPTQRTFGCAISEVINTIGGLSPTITKSLNVAYLTRNADGRAYMSRDIPIDGDEGGKDALMMAEDTLKETRMFRSPEQEWNWRRKQEILEGKRNAFGELKKNEDAAPKVPGEKGLLASIHAPVAEVGA